MVLQKDHDRIARWGHEENRWLIEDRIIYRWTDIRGRAITDWFADFDQALQFLVDQA
jgi:hypothetical protein